MTVALRTFNTDFTAFLSTKVRHTVKVVTGTEVLECSGMVLSQHSEVLKQLVLEDDEVFLDNYSHARDCLAILYGGSVAITMENVQDVLKFSVQFNIPEILQQTLAFIEEVVDETNVVEYLKICNKTVKFAKTYGRNVEHDIYWPCIRYIVSQDEAVASDIVSQVGQDIMFDVISNNSFMPGLLPYVTGLINQDNVEVALDVFDAADMLEDLISEHPDQAKVGEFFQKIESLSLSVSAAKVLRMARKFFAAKETLRKLSMNMTSTVTYSVKELLHAWKEMDEEQIMVLSTMVKSEDQFYLLEAIISWVAANKPNPRTVQKLWNAVKVSSLTRHYLDHTVSIFKSLGYDMFYNKQIAETSTVKCQHGIKSTAERRILTKWRNGTQRTDCEFSFGCINSSRLYNPKKCSDSNVTISHTAISVECRKHSVFTTPVYETNTFEATPLIYARAHNGDHLPFYTDLERAAGMDFDPNTFNILWGCCENVFKS